MLLHLLFSALPRLEQRRILYPKGERNQCVAGPLFCRFAVKSKTSGGFDVYSSDLLSKPEDRVSNSPLLSRLGSVGSPAPGGGRADRRLDLGGGKQRPGPERRVRNHGDTPANIPRGRIDAVTWTDSAGNLRLFGGYGAASVGGNFELNDLWEFNPSTSEWVWISGSSAVPNTIPGPPGVYGTLGQSAAGNVPGGRSGAVAWIDSKGNQNRRAIQETSELVPDASR